MLKIDETKYILYPCRSLCYFADESPDFSLPTSYVHNTEKYPVKTHYSVSGYPANPRSSDDATPVSSAEEEHLEMAIGKMFELKVENHSTTQNMEPKTAIKKNIRV